MSEVSKNEQLIHALLDGELDEARALQVRQMIAGDPQMRQFHDSCHTQRAALGALPRFTLCASFSDRVLQAAGPGLGAPTMERVTAEPPAVGAGFSMWQIASTAILSSAATLLVAMFFMPEDWADHAPLVIANDAGIHSSTADNEASSAIEARTLRVADALLGDDSLESNALVEPVIEQVWLLEAHDKQSRSSLARTLAANSIQIPAELSGGSVEVPSDMELGDALDQEINGILIEASALQMKNALLDLADSEEFEISAFTLPGHDAYFADIQQAQGGGNEPSSEPSAANEPAVVLTADQLADEAVAEVAGQTDQRLTQPPIAMAQQLRQRRFARKKTTNQGGRRKKSLLADDIYSQADGPEGLGGSAAPLFGVDKLPAVKKNVDALFPAAGENEADSQTNKGSYLLLIRNPQK